MPLPSGLSFIGIGKETTKGTGVVPSAYIPVTSIKPVDNVAYLEDGGFRGANVDLYNEIAGNISTSVDVSGAVFPDTIGYWLSMLGDVATTGSSAPFSHVFAVKNSGDAQSTSWSITDHYGATGGTPDRRYAGCQVAELDLKFNADGLFEYDAKLVGFPSVLVAKPTQSFSAIPPVPAWAMTCSIGGSNKTFVEQGQINIKRTTTPVFTVDGNQTPYSVWQGAVMVDGSMTLVVEDEVELTRYLSGTTVALVFDLSQGASSALVEVKLQLSKCQYTVGSYDRSKDYVELPITFKALGNTTDVGATGGFSQIKATLQNALPSGTFQ